jgi:hypothetical protein
MAENDAARDLAPRCRAVASRRVDDRRPARLPFPAALALALERYLAVHRLVLAASVTTVGGACRSRPVLWLPLVVAAQLW